jgi:protoheme ferro-lyase
MRYPKVQMIPVSEVLDTLETLRDIAKGNEAAWHERSGDAARMAQAGFARIVNLAEAAIEIISNS